MGSKVFNLCVVLFNVPFAYVAFFRGKHVYRKNDDVRVFGVYNCLHPTVLEMK